MEPSKTETTDLAVHQNVIARAFDPGKYAQSIPAHPIERSFAPGSNRLCVVSFADRQPYIRLQDRLVATFKAKGYTGDFQMYRSTDQLPEGCPQHIHGERAVPYAFKAYALRQAWENGYDMALWADSSIYAIRNPQEAFDCIAKDGYWLLNCGFCTGQWCSDAALVTLDVTREDLFSPQGDQPNWPHLMASTMGLDFRKHNCHAQAFLQQYFAFANDGVTFRGIPLDSPIAIQKTWGNAGDEMSADVRVRGHRHDQTAASVIAWKLGMRNWQNNMLVYTEQPDVVVPETAVFGLAHPGSEQYVVE